MDEFFLPSFLLRRGQQVVGVFIDDGYSDGVCGAGNWWESHLSTSGHFIPTFLEPPSCVITRKNLLQHAI
jgi:hypothetical protein